MFTTFLLAVFSQYYLRRYRPGWFRKYNFLASGASFYISTLLIAWLTLVFPSFQPRSTVELRSWSSSTRSPSEAAVEKSSTCHYGALYVVSPFYAPHAHLLISCLCLYRRTQLGTQITVSASPHSVYRLLSNISGVSRITYSIDVSPVSRY